MLDYMNHFFYLLDDLNLVTPIFFFTFVTPVTHYLPEKKSLSAGKVSRERPQI